MITAKKELEEFWDRRATSFTDALLDIALAYYGHGTTLTIPKARAKFADLLRDTLILADLNGRKRLYMEMDHALATVGKFAEGDDPPNAIGLTFDEAVEDLLTREPRLAKSAAEVARLYSTEHVFALARASEKIITEKVQALIAKGIVTGESTVTAIREVLEDVTPAAESYAQTVYRTNLSEAYNNGRIDQASDPDISEVIVGFKYVGVHDAATRPNHAKGFGTIAPTNDPLWNHFKPPNGYNCRCGLNYISRFEAERLGLWKNGKLIPMYSAPPNELQPDPGFKAGEF